MRHLIPRASHVAATLFGGRLHANKPVVGGRTALGHPAAALFYWSHSRTTDACEFPLHGHEGFEIITVVLAGENAHVDTATRRWTALGAGDFQVIAAGTGLSHGERLSRGTRAFQLWFDPDLRRALGRPPAYADHPAASSPTLVDGDARITTLVGDGAAVAATPGLTLRMIALPEGGRHVAPLAADRRAFVYVVDGAAEIDGVALANDDVLDATGGALTIACAGAARLFVVEVPAAPGYAPLTS
jgi:redox-sensitive bicupin YhaK (pirin superfamily)